MQGHPQNHSLCQTMRLSDQRAARSPHFSLQEFTA
jgi:hypothetical protein